MRIQAGNTDNIKHNWDYYYNLVKRFVKKRYPTYASYLIKDEDVMADLVHVAILSDYYYDPNIRGQHEQPGSINGYRKMRLAFRIKTLLSKKYEASKNKNKSIEYICKSRKEAVDNSFSQKNKFLEYLEDLDETSQSILVYRYVHDMTFSAIAKMLGIGVYECEKLHNKSLAKIRSNYVS